MILTPLELGLIIHYHSFCRDAEWLERNAPCKDDIMGHLMELGLLTDAPRTTPEGLMRYQPTPLLHAFVEMLCVTPLPELRWVDPRDVSVIKNATARVAIAAKLHVTPRT